MIFAYREGSPLSQLERCIMSPLRQRFIDDMRLCNLSPQTIEVYVHAVVKFAKHFKKSPEQLGPDQIREYQLHFINLKVSWSQFNQCVCALRFLYNTTLRRPHIIRHRLRLPWRGGCARRAKNW
jgi:hypothetical protein